MQIYNCDKGKCKDNSLAGRIYSGEELDIAGVAKDKEGNEIDFSNISLFQLIIRNMNGVVYVEYSTSPVGKQKELTTSGSKFTAKLLAEDTNRMRGLFVIETRSKVGTDIFIDVTRPFEVVDDFIKRTKEE